MKLAEALIERADLQKKISQICVRMKKNARTQEGEKPMGRNCRMLSVIMVIEKEIIQMEEREMCMKIN